MIENIQIPGERTLRVWFDTVFTPLINTLESQSRLLEQKIWSWNYYSQKLTAIHPLESRIEPRYRPNLYQVFEDFPQIQEAIKTHEIALLNLQKHCEDLYQSILKHQDFLATFDKIYNTLKEKKEITDKEKELLKFCSNEASKQIIAENMINHIQEPYHARIDYHYWQQYRNDFVRLLDLEDLKDYAQQTDKAGSELYKLVRAMLQDLRTNSNALGRKYDVPLAI